MTVDPADLHALLRDECRFFLIAQTGHTGQIDVKCDDREGRGTVLFDQLIHLLLHIDKGPPVLHSGLGINIRTISRRRQVVNIFLFPPDLDIHIV